MTAKDKEQERRDGDKQDRRRERTDWDCVSGIKLTICICIRLTERDRQNMTKCASCCWHSKIDTEEEILAEGKFGSCLRRSPCVSL